MKRRKFITRAGLALGGGLAASSCGYREEPSVAGAAAAPQQERSVPVEAASLDTWPGVRSQFALSPEVIHLGALLVATHPRPVQEAIDEYRRRLNADPVTYLIEQNNAGKQAAREAAAAYVGGEADEVALTDSTTMGIALVYHGLRLRPDQEVLTTEHAYYATDASLRLATQRSGASVRRVRLYDEPAAASAEQIVGRIREAIRPATRVLALTWVHSNTGVKLPLAQITEAVAEVNAGRAEADRVLVCVDGVHGFGIEDVTVDQMGCDFFMAGCHKWLFGPRGTGIVWGRPEAWADTLPVIPSFVADGLWTDWALEDEPSGPTTAARMTPGGFKPFEHQWAVADAFRFHQQIGKARVAERTHVLGRQLKEGLAAMPHVALHTPRGDDLSAGIVCFDVEGRSPASVVEHFAEQDIIATTTPYATVHARLTPCIYNTPQEIDAALGALRSMSN